MFASFINATARSASDILADLQACRQLRHVSEAEKQSIVKFFFGDIENSLLEGKTLPGVKNRYFIWSWEAFEEAVSIHGYCCDICNAIVQVKEDRWRYAADRMLYNLDGEVRLMLCLVCSKRFSQFCSRYFQRDARMNYSRELEQMMLAFIAHELGGEARRIAAGKPPRRRNHECSATVQNPNDRDALKAGGDRSGDITIDWSQPQHCG